MSRNDGFPIMDVSSDIANDPKFRRVQRIDPTHAAPAFVAYVAVLGESWKAGRRVSIADAWPALLPFDAAVVASMTSAGLIDKRGQVPAKSWTGWFEQARERREAARERWRRANQKRKGEAEQGPQSLTNDSVPTASEPRGSRDDTGAIRSSPSVPSVPTVPTESPETIPPPPAERGRRSRSTNPRANGTAPRDTGTNPRANGRSVRQEREAMKTGPTALGSILTRLAGQEPKP